jgi:TRAP-type uncharacterized transport system fused permease subunit
MASTVHTAGERLLGAIQAHAGTAVAVGVALIVAGIMLGILLWRPFPLSGIWAGCSSASDS